jgi:hypothetical protein
MRHRHAGHTLGWLMVASDHIGAQVAQPAISDRLSRDGPTTRPGQEPNRPPQLRALTTAASETVPPTTMQQGLHACKQACVGRCIGNACKTACMGKRIGQVCISWAYALQGGQLWARMEGQ